MLGTGSATLNATPLSGDDVFRGPLLPFEGGARASLDLAARATSSALTK